MAAAASQFHYDAAGRLHDDGFWTYDWDGAGRLLSMERKTTALPETGMTSEKVEFGYDADGRRTSKQRTRVYEGGQEKAEASAVLWAGSLPVLEQRSRDGVNLGRRWFQWGADVSGTLEGAGGIGGLLAIIEENAAGNVVRTLLPVQDGLGNITTVIDKTSGKTVAKYECGPFGEPLGEMGEADACPFRWQSKWYDAESQHYYFGYRHYDPRFGRWLSRDPIREEGGINLYAYCGNDPVNRHDPLGLMSDEERAGLQSTNAKLMEIIGVLGGKAGTPSEVYDSKLKSSWRGNTGFNFMLPIPFMGDRSKGFPWALQADIGIDDKAQLRNQYPWWESDHDIALRESVRANTVQFKTLLAKSGNLPQREKLALQLRATFAMWELTTIAATIPFQSLGLPWTGRQVSTPLSESGAAIPLSRIGLATNGIDDILKDVRLIGGHSPSDVMRMLDGAGIKYSIRPTTGSIKSGTVIDIEGGGTLNQLRFHPGGGRHKGSYWTISGDSGQPGISGKTQIIGPEYIPMLGQRANILEGYFNSDQ